jgi:hypothetical protein
MDLGTLDATGSGVSSTSSAIIGPFFLTSGATGQITTHSHFTDGILRGGLNYSSIDLITACAPAPAAWRCSPRSFAPAP